MKSHFSKRLLLDNFFSSGNPFAIEDIKYLNPISIGAFRPTQRTGVSSVETDRLMKKYAYLTQSLCLVKDPGLIKLKLETKKPSTQ